MAHFSLWIRRFLNCFCLDLPGLGKDFGAGGSMLGFGFVGEGGNITGGGGAGGTPQLTKFEKWKMFSQTTIES